MFDDAAAHLREVSPGLAKTTVDVTSYDFDHGDFAAGLKQVEAAYAGDPSRYAWLLAMMRWSQHDPGIDDDAGRREALTLPGFTYLAGVRGDDALVFQSMTEPFVAWRYNLFIEMALPNVPRYLADPRAKKLLRDNGFEAYWRVKGWPALCHPKGEHDFECGPAADTAAPQPTKAASGK
jgi:hypothetical protein